MRCLIGFLLSLTFLGSAAVTLAGELTSPKGFAITYPDEWTPATKEQLDEVAKKVKSARPVATIYGLRREKFADNLSIGVIPQVIPANADSEKQLIEVLKQSGMKISTSRAGELRQPARRRFQSPLKTKSRVRTNHSANGNSTFPENRRRTQSPARLISRDGPRKCRASKR